MDTIFYLFERGKLTVNTGTQRYLIKILLVMACLVYMSASNAEIYHCLDESGKTVFKDKECGSGEDSVEIITSMEARGGTDDVEEKVPNNIIIEDDKPGTLIFSNNRKLSPPYTIKVDS